MPKEAGLSLIQTATVGKQKPKSGFQTFLAPLCSEFRAMASGSASISLHFTDRRPTQALSIDSAR
jgi:hypothetical protein